MDYPKFVENGGVITSDGQELVNWMEATLSSYDKVGNIAAINGLDGSLQFYYTSVMKTGSQKPYSWLTSFNAQARRAYDIMSEIKTIAAKESVNAATATATAQNTDKVTALESALAEVKAALETKVSELSESNAKLLGEIEALKAKKSPGRPKKTDSDEGEPAESE